MKKILIIRFSSIGDIVLTTPIFRCIKEQLQESEIHFLTKRSYLPVIEGNPYIDKLITINQRVGEISSDLKKEEYDLIIDLHKNTRSFFVKLHLFNIQAFSFKKLNFKKWLLVQFKINKMPNIHIVDRYIETTKILGITNDGKGLDYFIPDNEKVSMNELPPTHHHGYIAIAMGSKHITKQMPIHKIIDLCQKINKPIVLLGGPEDREKAANVIASINKPIFNACGIYNINQSASLVQQANLIITPDTGLMHIAAAFNKPIISVWGNTVPNFGMYPYMQESHKQLSTIIEINNLPCRPCSKLGYKKCPKGHFKCMNNINTDSIANQVNNMVN